MSLELTGHAEIDQHHAILEGVLQALKNFGDEYRQDADLLRNANTLLNELAGELLAILIGHLAYEEKLMAILPETESCRCHIAEHKASHQAVLSQLKRQMQLIGKEAPEVVLEAIHCMVASWLGEHHQSYDAALVNEFNLAGTSEVDFDEVLVSMLDQHVFRGRPRPENVSATTQYWLRKKKLELHGRLERLSPAQKTVFWHVIAGRKNREIADLLACSVNTVKSHRAAIFQKMAVSSVLELVKKTEVFR